MLLLDAQDQDDAQTRAVVEVISALRADVLVLSNVDYDALGASLAALNQRLPAELQYPHLLPLKGNTGLPSGLDLDGDGRTNGPGDALAWGFFPGQGSLALLSRLPVEDVIDLSKDLQWQDTPSNHTRSEDPFLPLSRTGHWRINLVLPDNRSITVFATAATPPIPDDTGQNIRRNQDETAFWMPVLTDIAAKDPVQRFLLMGKLNIDPDRGNGAPMVIQTLLGHAAIHDLEPMGALGTATAEFETVGPLRVDYVLPSTGLTALASGVMTQSSHPELAAAFETASRHFPVWVDIRP